MAIPGKRLRLLTRRFRLASFAQQAFSAGPHPFTKSFGNGSVTAVICSTKFALASSPFFGTLAAVEQSAGAAVWEFQLSPCPLSDGASCITLQKP